MLRLRTSTCLSAPAQRFLAMFFICLLAACDRLGAQITDTELNPQNPLGFSWDGVDAQMLANPGRSRTQCEELVFDIEQIFGGRASAAIEQCAKEKTEEIFLTPEILPSSLRWGGVSVMMRGEIEPISYAYSYLHRIYPDYTLQDRGRRAFHAWKIDRKLRKSLGPPLAFGRFDEDSRTGFKRNAQRTGPCEFWISGDVGVTLCFERVIYEDGVELSLSFTRLDRASFGPELKCLVLEKDASACEIADSADGDVAMTFVKSLEVLGDWIGALSFVKCKDENLLLLETAWTLTQSELAKLAPAVQAYRGDALANYVIENFDSIGGEVSEAERHRMMLYLLKQAASQGSAIAMNEIGASLLYCHLNVRQNIEDANLWLERAAAMDEPYAIKSLAAMLLLRMKEEQNRNEEAYKFLSRCALIDKEYCSTQQSALALLIESDLAP